MLSDSRSKTSARFDDDQARFLTTISHELRTPLTSIAALSDLLSRGAEGRLDGQQAHQVDLIRKNARRLKLLVDDLFDITRISAGTLALEKAPFEAREFSEELADSLEPMLEEREQWVTLTVPEDEVWVEADRNRLEQVVSNLITNASKYSPRESEIRVSLSVEGGALLIEVSDDGAGISKADLEQLFTPFFRGGDASMREVQGSGLGLAVARAITELHGGTISVDSTRGKGSTFRVRLPGVIADGTKAEDTALSTAV